MNTSIIEIVFKVNHQVRFGEEIRVSGNVPALGCDDPSRSVPLVTSPTELPWWHTPKALFLPGERGVVRYRYCIFSGGKFNRWESDSFRVLDRERAEGLVVSTNDTFGLLAHAGSPKHEHDVTPSQRTVLTSTDIKSFRSRQFAEWSRKALKDTSLSPQDGVVVVSYFLPVILTKSSSGQWSAAWDGENILALNLNMRVTWIGSVRFGGAPIPPEEEESVARILNEMNCYPLFINQHMHHQFYEVYCKQHLWLVMHQVADVYGPLNQTDIGAKGQSDLWFHYSTVNRMFRDKIMEVYQQGDLVWIHGFHFMLLPSFLRRLLQSAKIGYFFHTPFPSSEIWRALSRREDLIRGILGADTVGFHLYEYARHFLSVCHRILGHNAEMSAAGTMTINVDGRHVGITCIHVGIDLPRLQSAFSSESFESSVLGWKAKFPNKVIVAGIDRLERLKGLPLKFSAIEKFMEENPAWQGKLMFTIIGISAGERGDDYRQTQHEVGRWVERLNSRFGDALGPLVHFEELNERNFRLMQRLAFFGASDIFMSTATRDGLNRFPMEFTLAKQRASQIQSIAATLGGNPLAHQGLVVMSEFISSARVMRGALTVNPWRVDEVKKALLMALEMSPSERADRTRRNLEFSTRLTTTNWAIHFLHDLKAVEKNVDATENLAIGFGMGFRVMGVKAGFQALDPTAVSKAYRTAFSRLIIMDWGGTLVADGGKDNISMYAVSQGHSPRAAMPMELKNALESLCADIRNTVFVVSGKELLAVKQYFGDVRGLGLGAEHGFYYRWPRDDSCGTEDSTTDSSIVVKSKWQTIHALGDQSWKEAASLIMGIYVEKTHGTYIETKGNALIWQFRDADPEFGFMQSKELEEHLKLVMPAQVVEVLRGGGVADGYIEVRPTGVSKGLFLQHAVSTLKALNKEADFILAIGDDSSDEPMFERVAALQAAFASPQSGSSSLGGSKLAAFSVTVGKKPTAAQAYVDDPAAVMELINTLIRTSQREKKHFSSVDLPSYVTSGLQVQTKAQASTSKDKHLTFTFDTVEATRETKPKRPSVSRAMSESNLSANVGEFFQRKSLAIDPIFDSPELSSESQLPRSASGTLLSMSDYLDSIDDQDKEGDSGGIFF